jgi:hypothetical protein
MRRAWADGLWTSALTFWEVGLLLPLDRLWAMWLPEAHLSAAIEDPADAFIAASITRG